MFGWLQSRITLCSLEPTASISFKLDIYEFKRRSPGHVTKLPLSCSLFGRVCFDCGIVLNFDSDCGILVKDAYFLKLQLSEKLKFL